jgi:hypothetical protein
MHACTRRCIWAPSARSSCGRSKRRARASERCGEIGIELAIDRGTKAGLHAFGDHFDHRPNGGTAFANAIEIIGIVIGFQRIGAEERIARHLIPIPARTINLMRPHLHKRTANRNAIQNLARNRASRDARRRLTRRRAPTAAIIADAIFHIIGIIGVSWAIAVFDVTIILAALIDILDQKRNRRAGG